MVAFHRQFLWFYAFRPQRGVPAARRSGAFSHLLPIWRIWPICGNGLIILAGWYLQAGKRVKSEQLRPYQLAV